VNQSKTLYDVTGSMVLLFGSSAQGGKANVISWAVPTRGTVDTQEKQLMKIRKHLLLTTV
jgi:hypothetical protein